MLGSFPAGRTTLLILILLTAAFACAALFSVAASAEEPISFTNDIYPILTDRCLGCHQPATKSGGLLMVSYADIKQGGKHGSPLVSGDPDASILIKYITGQMQPRMPKNMAPLSEFEIDLFRKWIRQGAADDTVSAATAQLKALEPPVYYAPPMITALAYSPDGNMLAISGNHEILLHRATGEGLIARLVGRAERIHSVVFSADGKTLAAVGGSPARLGEVQVWDVENKKLLRHSRVAVDTLYGASISPDAKLLSYGCADKTIRLMSIDTGEELKRMEHHADGVFGTVFSHDGKRLVSVSRDHFVKMTEVSSGAFIENLNLLTKATFGGQGELYCVALHPKSDIVISGGDDRIPRMYTMNRPRAIKIDDDSCLLREFEPQAGPVLSIAFSPDGSQVAVVGMSEEINIYSVRDGSKVAGLRGHQGGVYAVAYHPNGKQIAAAGFDGTVRIYDVAGGKMVRAFVPVKIEQRVAQR